MNEVIQNIDSNKFEILELIELPRGANENLRFEKIKNLFRELAANKGISAFIVKVKDRESIETVQVTSMVQVAQEAKQSLRHAADEIYLSSGKVNTQYLERNGELLFKAHEYALARNIYETILKSGENIGRTHLKLGECYLGEKNYAKAQTHLEESIVYQPHEDAYEALANCALATGKTEYAAEVLERALVIKSLSPERRLALTKMCAECWIKVNQYEKAETYFSKAIELDPRSDDLHANMGSILLQYGRVDEAQRAFGDAIALNSNNARAYLGLGCCMLADGEKRTAHDYFAKALEIELNNPTAIYYLVKCAYEIKSYIKAEQLLRTYADIGPLNPNLLYSLAGLQFHLEKFDAALNTLNKVLTMKVDHAGAAELKALIEKERTPAY